MNEKNVAGKKKLIAKSQENSKTAGQKSAKTPEKKTVQKPAPAMLTGVKEYSPAYISAPTVKSPFFREVDMDSIISKIEAKEITKENCHEFDLTEFDLKHITLYPLTSKTFCGLNREWTAKTLYDMGHLPVYISVTEPKWDRTDMRYPCSEKARQAVKDGRFWPMQKPTEDLSGHGIEDIDPYHFRGSNAARGHFRAMTFTNYTCLKGHDSILKDFDYYADMLHEDMHTAMAHALGRILRLSSAEAIDVLMSKFNGELSSLFMIDELWTINMEYGCLCSWTRTLAKDGNKKKMKKIGVKPEDAGSLFLKRVAPVVGPFGGRDWISTHKMTPTMRTAAAGAMWAGQCRLEKTETPFTNYTCGGNR